MKKINPTIVESDKRKKDKEYRRREIMIEDLKAVCFIICMVLISLAITMYFWRQ